MLRSLALVAVLCFAGRASAAELTEMWTSVRALGMGNAYTAVVDDTDSLFYNPAGLGRRGGVHWLIVDPRLGLDGMNAVTSVKDVMASDDVAESINNLYGDQIWVGGGAKSAFQIGSVAFGAFSGIDASGLLQNPAYPEFDFKYAADYGFTAGGAFDFIPSLMKVGAVARRITRVGTSAPIGVSTLATLDSKELEQSVKNRGSGWGLDLGLLLTAPTPVRPSVSLVWKNIGNTQFSHEGGAAAPARIESEMIIGASLELDAGIISITPAVDYKYINREDVQMGKKIHMGVEVGLPVLALRAGLNQGYYTLGAGLDFGLLQIDAATYGVELGEYPGQLEDRRYMAQLTIELGFDFGGIFGDSSGKNGSGSSSRRRLKQRR